MQALIKKSGIWKNAKQLFVKQSGAWKTVKQGFVKVGGVWKQFYSTATQVVAKVVTYNQSAHNNSAEYVLSNISGTGIQYKGYNLYILIQAASYTDGTDAEIAYYTFGFYFDQNGPQPDVAVVGNIKITNLSSGISLVLTPDSSNGWLWSYQLPNNSGQNYPENPYNNWLRNNTIDVIQFEAG
jgi:hypothetical protein